MTYSLAQCLKQSLQIIMLLTLTSEHAVAQDFNKGVTAYNSHDYAAALKELTPLANSNDPDAQAILRLMYRRGQGVAKDNKKSFAWYVRAAKQGHVEAQALVGGFLRVALEFFKTMDKLLNGLCFLRKEGTQKHKTGLQAFMPKRALQRMKS